MVIIFSYLLSLAVNIPTYTDEITEKYYGIHNSVPLRRVMDTRMLFSYFVLYNLTTEESRLDRKRTENNNHQSVIFVNDGWWKRRQSLRSLWLVISKNNTPPGQKNCRSLVKWILCSLVFKDFFIKISIKR